MSASSMINDSNISNIREQIQYKKGHSPYYATVCDSKEVITDYDKFPYPRWYRGVPQSSYPVIAEREAGYRERQPDCYNVIFPDMNNEPYPNHCFEGPCSMVAPCYPRYLEKISDRDALNVMLNRACISQYR